MQKGLLPTPHHHFDRRPSATAPNNMAQLRTTTTTTTTTRASISAVGGAFANSKFFLKKQNKAATKIQSLCRAFLVQARLYRQRVLEPRFQEIRDCEARKAEELLRIQEQLKEERLALPFVIKQEAKLLSVLKTSLEKEIEEYKKTNEPLKEERKEEKRKNKELEQESRRLKDSTFKLDVQNTKLTAEIAEQKAIFEKYEFAVKDGKEQMNDLEAALLKACYQQGVMKKYIGRIIKMVDEKTKEQKSPPSSPKQRRKSVQKGKTNSKSKRLRSANSHPGNASFNWQSYDNSKSDLAFVLEDEEIEVEDLKSQPDEDKNNCIFDWATKSYQSIDTDDFAGEEDDEETEATKEGGSRPRRESALLELVQDELKALEIEEEAKESKPRRNSKSKKEETAPKEGERKSRRQSSKPQQKEAEAAKDGDRKQRRQSKKIDKAAKNATKELVQELKAIKKEGLKREKKAE